MNNNRFDYGDALVSLHPNQNWSVIGLDYSSLVWNDTLIPAPTEEKLKSEIAKLQKEYRSEEYKLLRKAEYPDIAEYIDGVVKGDQSQIDNYILKCINVKKKYPKSQ